MSGCEWLVDCDDVVLLEGGSRGCAVESSNGSVLTEQSSGLGQCLMCSSDCRDGGRESLGLRRR